ncbi:MAG: VOC family protein [Actinomycetota bacterium]
MSLDSAWKITGLHHVAFAHGDDPASEEALCRLIGIEPHEETGPGFVERMYGVGDAYIQTLEATGDGVVQRFLDKRGPGLHHVAFAVDDLEAALEDLRGQGVRLVDEHPRPGGMGTRVAFVHPSGFGGLLVELVEHATD